MKLQMSCQLVVLASILAVTPAMAQRKATFTGAGVLSCGEFINSKDQPGAAGFYAQWAQGYMTGYNYFAQGPQVVTPEPSTILLFSERHCRNNPLDTYAQAIGALINEIGGTGFLAKPTNDARK